MTAPQKPAIVLAIRHWNPAPWIERFSRAAPDRAVIFAGEGFANPPEAYYLCCWKPDPAVFHLQPRPRLICSLGAGVDHVMQANPPADVPVTRIVDTDLTGRMVEYVVLHALWHFRQMAEHGAAQREKRWIALDQPAARDVTVGMLGVGEMGQAAARGLKAVGFTVIGWGRNPRAGLEFPAFHGMEGLNAFLAQTDILVSLLPSTPETRGLVDTALLKKLRNPGPLGAPAFINAGRGDAVVEDDMVAALRQGLLRSASLDVFRTEPLPANNPFWDMQNVLLTPHNAADSSPDAIVAAVMAEIAQAEAGLPPIHPVDIRRGY